MMDWKREIENRASNERSYLSNKSVSELLEMIRCEKYGTYHTIWDVVTRRGSLKDTGWVLFDALSRLNNGTARVACASALITTLCTTGLKTKPYHFLDAVQDHNEHLIELEKALERRIGGKP
ncbi:TPA: hypothetical protein AB5H75_003895 [Vibrio mimicus]